MVRIESVETLVIISAEVVASLLMLAKPVLGEKTLRVESDCSSADEVLIWGD